MSYDVEVATHAEPGAIEAPDGVTVDRPSTVEAEDLAESLAAAVLAPRWLIRVSGGNAEAARKLGRRIAKQHGGAAYDPQDDVGYFSRGKPKRAIAQKPSKTSLVRLEWYVPDERWPDAPAALVRTLARRCPEARPTRYGDIEPLQQRYDPANPEAFTDFARDDHTFWFSSRPSFGGHAFEPGRGPGHLGLDLDWRVVDADARWREAIAELFASAIGAIYGECWVEPGWNVSRNNRLSIAGGRRTRLPAFGREGWTLPTEGPWLSWFGNDCRATVVAALDGGRTLRRGVRRPLTPVLTEHAEGVCVRLGERPRKKLPPLPLPADLISLADETRR